MLRFPNADEALAQRFGDTLGLRTETSKNPDRVCNAYGIIRGVREYGISSIEVAVYLKGYITNKEELTEVIKELKNCTPWKILDREPPLCKFFDSECQPRTENPYDSVTSALKALPPPRQSFDVAQPKQNSGTLRDLALETARQAAPQAALDDLD